MVKEGALSTGELECRYVSSLKSYYVSLNEPLKTDTIGNIANWTDCR